MGGQNGVVNLIGQLASARGLDPQAVLAVASQEGLGGGIGDNGTSFGPWQLHQGGALPSGIPLSQANQWAWSSPGLNYALDAIARVAHGLKGAQAIQAIVQGFERPANPGREIAGASRSYGLPASAGVPSGVPAVAAALHALGGGSAPSAPAGLPPWLTQVLAANRQTVGLAPMSFPAA